MTQSAAEGAAETRRMRGRKPKAPQYCSFDAVLNVRPPFFKLANRERLRECDSLLAEPGWPDGAVKNEGSASTDLSNITATRCAHLPRQPHLRQNYV